MFLGQYRHQLDAKGRVAVPAQFRKGLGAGGVVAIGPDRRLLIWPMEEWSAMTQEYRRSSGTAQEERAYARRLYASARDVELDGQGRMLLTADHRAFAGIGDRAVFVGVGNCIEVTSEEVWDAEMGGLSADDFTALHDRVSNQKSAERAE